MSKGGGKTQTVNQAPWAGAQPGWMDVFKRAGTLSQGSGISPTTNNLGTQFINESQQTPKIMGQAESQLGKTLTGGYLNPYTSGAMGDAMDMAKSKINAQFGGDNFGNSAHQEWLGRGITAAGLPFAQQAFESERGRQMQAAGMAPELGMADLSRLGQGLQVSQQFDNDSWNQLQKYGSLLGAAGGGQTTQPLYSNSAAQTFGTLGMLGSIFGPMVMASDVRLKTDIQKVGEKDGHNVYSYRYKGEPQTHVGVMAQEVLMKKPEAVHDIGGLLAVDYSKLGDK
jgi:hypothetical protein